MWLSSERFLMSSNCISEACMYCQLDLLRWGINIVGFEALLVSVPWLVHSMPFDIHAICFAMSVECCLY